MEKLTTLFDRVGGEQGVKNLVRSFYDRVLTDSELAHFFEVLQSGGSFRTTIAGGVVLMIPAYRLTRRSAR